MFAYLISFEALVFTTVLIVKVALKEKETMTIFLGNWRNNNDVNVNVCGSIECECTFNCMVWATWLSYTSVDKCVDTSSVRIYA